MPPEITEADVHAGPCRRATSTTEIQKVSRSDGKAPLPPMRTSANSIRNWSSIERARGANLQRLPAASGCAGLRVADADLDYLDLHRAAAAHRGLLLRALRAS